MSRLRNLTRTAAGSGIAALLVLGSVTPAMAGDGSGSSGEPPAGSGGSSGDGSIGAQVQFKTNFKGGKGASPIARSEGSWDPPLCWTQPKFTGKQYKEDSKKTAPIDPSSGKTLPGWDKGKDFHEKDKGAWWYRTYDVDRLRAGNATPAEMAKCTPIKPVQWVEEGDPPKEAISPLVLAGLAYARTKLPAPPVTLRPAADNQIVNLATHVKFDAPIDPVWVTAHFDHLGVDIAATTVAKPVALRVDAGTEFADPQSCTYDLTKSKSGYQLDTSKDACNIKYRKSSGDGAYPLQARVTWKVTWTDSADPEGPARQPALPDGLSTFEQDVAVKEIQSINR
ncbi:hypothetical protein [Streptomyces formicae]|uniref:Secreted protein n=1 Tax=Streptomyces formicae TaxID=1616117 RepID=A0A291QDY8_9ACTN|nr:hypothetical protein [Streptomyces formicae]ATL29673.1 secreted protein [Streptomyces formicae]